MSDIVIACIGVDQAKLKWRAPRIDCQSIASITAGGMSTCNDGQQVFNQDRNNGGNCPSDIRLKQDIAEVGSTPDGLKLYSFRYNWDEETFVGVMAQDVLEVMPEAVVTRTDGFYAVDYGMLGLEMISVDKWRAGKAVH